MSPPGSAASVLGKARLDFRGHKFLGDIGQTSCLFVWLPLVLQHCSAEAGELLKNPALADVLLQIAAQGAGAMREGTNAQAVVKKCKTTQPTPAGSAKATWRVTRSINASQFAAIILRRMPLNACAPPLPRPEGIL